MAVKTASKRKIKSFDVGAQDEALNEVLSAGKSTYTYNVGSIIPYDPYAAEVDDLIIEEPVSKYMSDGVVSYADVQERTAQVAKEHEDPETRLKHKEQSRRLTRRKVFETIFSIILVIAILRLKFLSSQGTILILKIRSIPLREK